MKFNILFTIAALSFTASPLVISAIPIVIDGELITRDITIEANVDQLTAREPAEHEEKSKQHHHNHKHKKSKRSEIDDEVDGLFARDDLSDEFEEFTMRNPSWDDQASDLEEREPINLGGLMKVAKPLAQKGLSAAGKLFGGGGGGARAAAPKARARSPSPQPRRAAPKAAGSQVRKAAPNVKPQVNAKTSQRAQPRPAAAARQAAPKQAATRQAAPKQAGPNIGNMLATAADWGGKAFQNAQPYLQTAETVGEIASAFL